MHPQRTSPHVGGYTTQNTVAALELLALAPRSAPELAEELAIDVRSARRLLGRLREDGYAVQDAGHRRRYRPTLRLVAVALPLLARSALPARAAPVLAALAQTTGAPARLIVSSRAGVCSVARADSDGDVDLRPRVDEPGPDGLGDSLLAAGTAYGTAAVYLRRGGRIASAATVVESGQVVGVVVVDSRPEVATLAAVQHAAESIGRRLGAA